MRVIRCASCRVEVGVESGYTNNDGHSERYAYFNACYGGDVDSEQYCIDCYDDALAEYECDINDEEIG